MVKPLRNPGITVLREKEERGGPGPREGGRSEGVRVNVVVLTMLERLRVNVSYCLSGRPWALFLALMSER